jgi:hypothetical protein
MKPCHELPLPPARRLHDGLWLAAGVLLVSALTIGMQVAVPWVLIALLGGPEMSPARRRLAAVAWLLAACALAGAAAAAPAAPLPGTLRGYRPAFGRGRRRTAVRHRRLRAAVPAVVRRRGQTPLAANPGRQPSSMHRGPDAWVFPPGHPAVEGVLARRPAGGDALHRTHGRRIVALRLLCVERGRHRCRAGPSPRHRRAARARRAAGRYAVPSRTDCLACHASTTVPVLGLGVLQLSADRDPLAPGGRPLRAASSTCARWWRAAGCADCRRRWRRNRRA